MNFNKEIAQDLKELNLGGNLSNIDDKDKATPEDFAKLEAKIALHCHQNEIMLEKSAKANILPLG